MASSSDYKLCIKSAWTSDHYSRQATDDWHSDALRGPGAARDHLGRARCSARDPRPTYQSEREIRIMRIIIAEFINISWVWQVLPWSDSFSRVSTGRQRKVSIQCQPTVDLYWQRQTRMLLSLNLASVSHTAHKSITSKPRQFARNIREKNKSQNVFILSVLTCQN